MKYTPKTEDQVLAEGLNEPGFYDFEIIGAEDAISKNNNEMIKISLNIFDEDGKPIGIDDYLLSTYQRKFRHAADACKLLTKYEDGTLLASDFIGKTGKLELAIQKGKEKPDGSGNYPDKNSIKDYVKRDNQLYGKTPQAPAGYTKPAESVATGAIDDEIPF